MTNRGGEDIAFPILVGPDTCLESTVTFSFGLAQDGSGVEEFD